MYVPPRYDWLIHRSPLTLQSPRPFEVTTRATTAEQDGWLARHLSVHLTMPASPLVAGVALHGGHPAIRKGAYRNPGGQYVDVAQLVLNHGPAQTGTYNRWYYAGPERGLGGTAAGCGRSDGRDKGDGPVMARRPLEVACTRSKR